MMKPREFNFKRFEQVSKWEIITLFSLLCVSALFFIESLQYDYLTFNYVLAFFFFGIAVGIETIWGFNSFYIKKIKNEQTR